jgi:hypothetical protein
VPTEIKDPASFGRRRFPHVSSRSVAFFGLRCATYGVTVATFHSYSTRAINWRCCHSLTAPLDHSPLSHTLEDDRLVDLFRVSSTDIILGGKSQQETSTSLNYPFLFSRPRLFIPPSTYLAPQAWSSQPPSRPTRTSLSSSATTPSSNPCPPVQNSNRHNDTPNGHYALPPHPTNHISQPGSLPSQSQHNPNTVITDYERP